MRQRYAIDDARLTTFHVKICAFTTGGVLCDGYLLGIIAPALALYSRQQALSATWTGLVGASALIGLFLGSVLFGWLTDALGRQVMYLAGLLAFVGGSLLQAFTTDVA
ncbi:MFS transporter [Streptomyces albiflaviniger]|nr:MFS transporter [Streptomyces albiflaviniger]